jgi:hypothetical protein
MFGPYSVDKHKQCPMNKKQRKRTWMDASPVKLNIVSEEELQRRAARGEPAPSIFGNEPKKPKSEFIDYLGEHELVDWNPKFGDSGSSGGGSSSSGSSSSNSSATTTSAEPADRGKGEKESDLDANNTNSTATTTSAEDAASAGGGGAAAPASTAGGTKPADTTSPGDAPHKFCTLCKKTYTKREFCLEYEKRHKDAFVNAQGMKECSLCHMTYSKQEYCEK